MTSGDMGKDGGWNSRTNEPLLSSGALSHDIFNVNIQKPILTTLTIKLKQLRTKLYQKNPD